MVKDKLKDFASIIPLFTVLVYGLGFVVINGYLSQYNLVLDDLVNSNYIKSGLSFLILTTPILFVLYLNFDKPTDNLTVAKKYFPTFAVNILTYLLVITLLIFIIDYKKITNLERTLLLLGVSIDGFTYILATSILFKNKKHATKIIMQLIIPVSFLIYFGIKFHYLAYLYFIILIMCIAFVLALGVVADKIFTWGHYISQIMWIVLISYLFGNFVYGNLPSFLGGGTSFSTTLIAKKDNSNYLKCIGLSNKEDILLSVEILYISSDKYLIRSNNKIFYVSKSLFEGFIANSSN